jgi:nucleoside-diphosphate-sugar epimerase
MTHDSASAGEDVRHLLCLGFGYTARHLAARLDASRWRISGTSRTPEGAAAIRALGHRGLVLGDGPMASDVEAAVTGATHILVSVPPTAAGDPMLERIGSAVARAPRRRWIGYLSTIGVYGDHAGAWVDETTAPAPTSPRSRWRLAAEEAWLALGEATGSKVQVFRLPGIYGPGRSALDQLRAGTARRIDKPGQVFNRMHVADIAAALEAAMDGLGRQPIYNLADDEPAPQPDVVAFAARLLGIPVPPLVAFDPAELSPMARSFYGECKRVSGALAKADLGLVLAYPTYREGLAAILAAQGTDRS